MVFGMESKNPNFQVEMVLLSCIWWKALFVSLLALNWTCVGGVIDELYNAAVLADVKAVRKLLANRDIFVSGKMPIQPNRVRFKTADIVIVYELCFCAA